MEIVVHRSKGGGDRDAQIEGRWRTWHRSKAGGDQGRRKEKASGDQRSPWSTTSSAAPPSFILIPTTKLGQIGLFFFSFLFFFFSYFLVLIQLYCKNWILFCVWIMWDVFWKWSKETETKIRHFLNPAILFLFLLFFCVFFFFFYGSDSKGTVRSDLITVLRTMRLNRGSNGSLLFWHRPVLKLKRTVIVRRSRLFWSHRTVWSGFQNLD